MTQELAYLFICVLYGIALAMIVITKERHIRSLQKQIILLEIYKEKSDKYKEAVHEYINTANKYFEVLNESVKQLDKRTIIFENAIRNNGDDLK